MNKNHVPCCLWDFGIVWVAETGNITVNSSHYSNGRTPLEIVTGETPDISEYLDFGFYDWVVYRQNAGLGENQLGCWLGISHKVGRLMSYWILTQHGHVLSRTSVQRLTELEKQTADWQTKCTVFDANIKTRLDNTNFTIVPDRGGITHDHHKSPLRSQIQQCSLPSSPCQQV